MKYTKGPWEIANEFDIYNDKKALIATLSPNNTKANARLIAAAPELLEALKSISIAMAQPKDRISVITPESYEKIREFVQGIIKQAIAKAEGR